MRKKVRKSLAFLLALALVVSVMSGLGLSVSADEAQPQTEPAQTEEVQDEAVKETPKAEKSTPKEGEEEEEADPDAEAVPEEKKDEQKAEGEGSGEKAAENKDAATPKAGENVQTATIGTGDKTVTVKTTAAAGVLPEGAKLVVKKLANQDQAYQDAESTLKDSQVTYDDFLALDVGFEVNGKEVEPEAGSVQVQFELGAGLLPETADTNTLAVQHLTDGKAETVADAGAVTAGDVTVNSQVIKADFEVKSFSTFTITWGSGRNPYFKATVYYVDEKGNDIDTGKEANVSATGNQTLDIKKEYGHDISGYTYSTVRYQNPTTGKEIAQIETTENTTTDWRGNSTTTRTVTLVMRDGTKQELRSGDTSTKIYLIYTKNTEGGHTGPSQTLAHEKYVTDKGDHTYDLSLTVSGKKGSKTSKAKVDILLILDKSGSMGWGMKTYTGSYNSNYVDPPNRRIDKVANAVSALTTNLKDNENIDARYSVVSFAETASTDQDWTSSASAAYATVANATPSGGTNYQAGIYEAKKQLTSSRKDAQTIVIFLTDGAPTFQGQTTASGEGSFTEQRYIDAAKNELRGMTADGFYCVGVMLDSTITVYTANGTDFWGNTKWESEEKTGEAILQEIIAGGTNIKDKPAPMMASNPQALNAAFDNIKAKITDLLCDHVIVTDVLSENVKMVTNSETDTTPKKLVVTIKKNDEAGTVVAGPETSVTDGEYTITARYDAVAKQITLDFPANYTLNPDYTYIVTATIEATEKAYENVRANKGVYPDIGDAGTGDTSADQRGVYSNKDGEAKVSYRYNDSDKTEDYNRPVIQLEPAHLTINKTITGLTEEQIEAALKNKLTFNITYTYPDKTTGNAQVKLDKVTAGGNGEYTFTYTSGDIWSMGANYEVTETDYTVTDYDCNATPTDAKGSIPKYSTATASFTNNYTKATQDLTITKEIWVDGSKYEGAEFDNAGYTFTVTGDKLTEARTVTVNGAGSETIENLPVGSYMITETGCANEPAKYKYVKDDGPKTITLSKENHAVTITNKYETKKCKVYVRKELDGNMYDSSDEFSFNVDGKDGPLTLGKDQTSGAYEVTYGNSFTVKETNDKGYTSTTAKAYKATVNDDGTVRKGEEVNGIYTDNTKSYTLSDITEDIIIVYTNTKQINPPNGIITTIAPYAIMVVLAAGAGVYFVYSRRRRNR